MTQFTQDGPLCPPLRGGWDATPSLRVVCTLYWGRFEAQSQALYGLG